MTQTRSRQAGIAPHTDANATALPTRTTRSIVRLRAISCGAILKRHAPPEWAPARLSHTARRCREHAQSVPRASSFCSSRPQSRPFVSRQHCGCKEHSSSEPLGLERPAALAAALEQRPAGSPWCLRPTRSFRPRLTACGRRVRSVGNDWWRRGGQPTLILDAPALPKSRCGQRCIGSRLAADLHWKVEPDALMPMARCTGCVQRPRSRSAHAHDLSRPGALADGPVSHHGSSARVRFVARA